MKTQQLLVCLSGVMLLFGIANAEEVNFGKHTPTAQEVIEALSPTKSSVDSENPPENVKKSGTRSINMNPIYSKPKTNAKPHISTPKVDNPTSTDIPPDKDKIAISLEITFAYDSAQLTSAAEEQLRPVGEALASGKLSSLSFIVEGHTDAIGSQAYNLSLSQQRADSVTRFLQTRYNIPLGTKIDAVGRGKNDLLDPNNPASEVNRRVRIVAVAK
jgi:outer membrane protein OmpA-like peptidoglycan-associated protein